jgi:flagellar basal body-associated protein FliL
MPKTKAKRDRHRDRNEIAGIKKKKLPIWMILCMVFISLWATITVVMASASVTESEAEGISKKAPEAADLISKHPESFPVVFADTFNLTPCWVVDWWTNEQLERGLQYPNVRVWIDKENGGILSSGIPRGKEEVKYPIPTPVPSKEKNFLILIPLIVIAAIIVIIAVLIRKRRR